MWEKIILYFRKNIFSFLRSLEIYENRSSRVTSESLLKFESVLYNTSYNFTCTLSCTTEARAHAYTKTWRHTDIILQRCCYWYTGLVCTSKILYMAIPHTNIHKHKPFVRRTQNNIIICERKNLQSLCLCYVFHIPHVYINEHHV